MSLLLTTEQTDQIVLDHCRPEWGAIEDEEQRDGLALYFFESGHVVSIDLATGAISTRSDY